MIRVFVYGTLKAGFPNHHHNQGALLELATTTESYPLYLVGPRRSPWLLDRPGQGFPVSGEVYAVDEPVLAQMDHLERVAEPDGYRRHSVSAVNASGQTMAVEIYLKPAGQLVDEPIRDGPFPDYTAELAALYRPRPSRGVCT